uniref:p-aminobenzoyl-glutamate transporter n=1 Tax=uncultured Planctomycetota bacterium TaxID=120965 RepID=H5S889_9BACT|nr:p-aminobenzoyl-glutamate transporter [uncultured Planctomycetota bacterium]
MDRFLDAIQWAGNKLPDPALIFLWALLIVWVLSAFLAPVQFRYLDPRTAKPGQEAQLIRVQNQLSGTALTNFIVNLVDTFVRFPPLGVVLVALLGVGVAEHTGLIHALIKGLLNMTPRRLLTPMLLIVAIMSHSAGDTGYVLVIPLGGMIFAAAGRHPLAGIVCAFAGVSGGFSANFLPSGLDPLLQGFTQSAAQIIEPGRQVNPLCNYWFMSASSLLIVAVGWYLTDKVIEPRLRAVPVSDDPSDNPTLGSLSSRELLAMGIALFTIAAGAIALVLACILPERSPLASPKGSFSDHDAPLMRAIVPLIFLFFLVPGIVYGLVAGTVKSHRDVIQAMTKSMQTMGYYLVLAFFAAQFTYAFAQSNLGALLAIAGADFLRNLGLPNHLTIIGIILLSTLVNLLIGSASAKWAILSPIFVPMLMQLGLSPELTQAAYRIGDSSTNIITPLLPYFPLIVAYAQRYVKEVGVGTLISLMLPYSIGFLITWMALLMVWWVAGLPLGLPTIWGPEGYTYTPTLPD